MLWEKPDELPELTDLCAIGGYRFVVGANGDGYLVDLALGTSRQHFCLEPDGILASTRTFDISIRRLRVMWTRN